MRMEINVLIHCTMHNAADGNQCTQSIVPCTPERKLLPYYTNESYTVPGFNHLRVQIGEHAHVPDLSKHTITVFGSS